MRCRRPVRQYRERVRGRTAYVRFNVEGFPRRLASHRAANHRGGRHAAIWIEFADAGDHYPGLCLFDLDPCVVIGHDRLGATDAIGSACVTREARLGSFRDQVEGFVEAERHAFRVGLLELLLAEVGAHLAEAVVAVARLRRADAHFCGWGGVGGDYVCAQWSPGGCWLTALVAT